MTAHEAQLKGYHLKKQTQFAVGRNSAKSYMKGDYDNKPASGAEENKAKQSQFQKPTADYKDTSEPLQPWPEQGRWLVWSCFFDEIWLIEYVQAFLGCVTADGPDFFGSWAAVDFGVRRRFVAWAILVHDVDGCFRADRA